MKPKSQNRLQLGFYSRFEDQLNPAHPLYQLANSIDWAGFERDFLPLYCADNGPAKPIRRMIGLLILKHLRNRALYYNGRRMPISGKASFSRIWSPQQSLRAGEEVMAIVPDDFNHSSALLGKVQLPVENAGKISPGQKAILKLDGYPEQQYGVVEVAVANISLLPQQQEKEAVYLIDLELPYHLWSSNKKEIPFRQEMSGQVRVITEDRRVLDRIFGQLRALINRT